jgi:hypothetical protein
MRFYNSALRWFFVLGLVSLIICGGFIGCGKKITEAEVGRRAVSDKTKQGWFGEKIYNTDVRPRAALAPVPNFKNKRVKLAIPRNFYPGSKQNEESERDILPRVCQQFAAIWTGLEESVGLTIEPVFYDSENDPVPREADCAIVSDFSAYDLYLSHSLKRLNAKAVPNVVQIDSFYKVMLKGAVNRSSDIDAAFIGDYCLPYAFSLVGFAVDPLLEKEAPRSLRSLFEPKLGSGELRLYSEENILFRSAQIYLRSKLQRAKNLIGEELMGVYPTSVQTARLRRAQLELDLIINNERTDLASLRFPIEELISFLEAAVQSESRNGQIPVVRQASNSEVRHATGEIVIAGEIFRKLRIHLDALFNVTVARQSDQADAKTDEELRGGLKELLKSSISSKAVGVVDGIVGVSGVPAKEVFSIEELAALEHFLVDGLELSSGIVSDRIRNSFGLLLSYIQYLPRTEAVIRQFPGALPTESRWMSEFIAIVNMLKGQAFSVRGQSALYDNAGGLEFENGRVSVAQMSGGRAAYYLRMQHTQNAMRAAEREKAGGLEELPAGRAIGFVLPEEGCPIRCYHLVMLRESPEVEWSINSLLRTDVAASLANFFLFGTTEPSARSLVDREILTSPAYSVPEDTAQISPPDLDPRTRMAINMVGDEVKRYFLEAKTQTKKEMPMFPFGIRLRAEAIAQLYE